MFLTCPSVSRVRGNLWTKNRDLRQLVLREGQGPIFKLVLVTTSPAWMVHLLNGF